MRLSDYQKRRLVAQAEVAYYYTRFGLRHYERAIELFEIVLQQVQTGETIEQTLVSLWKLGLAMTLRRVSHIGHIENDVQSSKVHSNINKAIQILTEIIKSNWHSQRNKAFACVELASLAYYTETAFKGMFRCSYKAADLYRMAEKLGLNDTYILQKYAKFLKVNGKQMEADELLRKSVAICPTLMA